MEGLIFDLPFKPGETINLTVYSDLHLDAESCCLRALKEHMAKRAALPNALFIGIGDFGNWIMPHGQDPRSTPSTAIEEVAGRDDYVNHIIEYHAQHLRGYPWLFCGMGNHEYTMLKHHGIDVVAFLCDALSGKHHPQGLQVQHGWYSGFARFRFHRPRKTVGGCDGIFNLLYHHGFTTGQASDGVPPAVTRWASAHENWNVCVYGHNHRMAMAPLSRVHMTAKGRLEHTDSFIVGTGTFARSERQSGPPDYSEIKGFRPVYIGAPLIKILMHSDHDGWKLDYAVETATENFDNGD